MSPVFRSDSEVVTKVTTFFLFHNFMVWGYRVKPGVKPKFSNERMVTIFKDELVKAVKGFVNKNFKRILK